MILFKKAQADSHGVLLFSKRPGGERPIPSLLPFACIKMRKVVSLGFKPITATLSHSAVDWCNSRSVPLNCGHRGKAAQPGTRIQFTGFIFFYILKLKDSKRWSLRSLLVWKYEDSWWKSCLGFSAWRRHRWNEMCPLILLFFSMAKPVLKCK